MKDWIGFRFEFPNVGDFIVRQKEGEAYYAMNDSNVALKLTESQLLILYEEQLIQDHPGVLLDLMSLPKDLKFSKAQMEAIEYADFERYIADRIKDWQKPNRLGNFYRSYKLDGSHAGFPISHEFTDYGISVGMCIRDLAEADERSMMSVYLELRWKIKE